MISTLVHLEKDADGRQESRRCISGRGRGCRHRQAGDRREDRRAWRLAWGDAGLDPKPDPAVVEDVKWRKPSNPLGVPVWSHGDILCTGETYKDKVKLTFAHGASLPDPSDLFNAGLDGGVRRAIDLRDGDIIDEAAFRALVASAVASTPVSPKGRFPRI